MTSLLRCSFHRVRALLVFVVVPFCAAFTPAAIAETISPPSVKLIDDFGVNLSNGQVYQSLNTVAIGGAMGLSHSLSLYTNHFFPLRGRGYSDKFDGGSRYTQMASQTQVQSVMRVYDFAGTVDFRVYVNGALYNGVGSDVMDNYTFVPLHDERDRLQVSGSNREFLDWTKADGTVSRFRRNPNPPLNGEGRLAQVTSPNGFTVFVDLPNSVSTNTGFAIVYQYEPDSRGVPACANPAAGVPGANVATWAAANPRYVKAVNAASCAPTNASCLSRAWPTATFTWPAGMPRLMYCGESVFEVQTPTGTTTYRYKPHDLAYSGSNLVEGYTPGEQISPRLYKIKPANSTVESIEYTYKNIFQIFVVGVREDTVFTAADPGTYPTQMGFFERLVQQSGTMVTARVMDRTNEYQMGGTYIGQGSAQNLGSLDGGVWRVIRTVVSDPPYITEVNTKDAKILFEASTRNYVQRVEHNTGVTETFAYTRGNVSEIKANGTVMSHATYPPAGSCDTNPKTCNLATSVFDAKNNETQYEYHPASGQVSRVIPPADASGKRAELRIDYQQYRARYFDASGNRVEGSPIYLKSAERHCHDSNYASADPSAACAANDEVITRYYYNNNNLLLTSVATTDWSGKTLRTCYQYDVFGNKLGETQPKGAINCN
jgi:hypothetical protein